MRERKFEKLFVVIIMVYLFFPIIVFGETFKSESSCYNYNHSTGAYGGSGCSDYLKRSSTGKLAFCSQFGQSFSGTSCSIDSTWKTNKKYAIVTGYIIRTVYDDEDYSSYSSIKKYGVSSIAINTYLANNYASSWGKYSRGSGRLSNDGDYTKNATVKAILDSALAKYSSLKLTTTKLPAVTFKVSNATLKTAGSQYISDVISTSGVVSTYGEADTSYTISATVPNGAVQICLKADGTKCVTKYELKKSGDVKFYLKVIPNSGKDLSNQTVTVSISGSNTTSYATSVRYNCGSGKQHLIMVDKDSISRSVRASALLKVPSQPDPEYVQHRMSAFKVDDTGDQLDGATIELWQDDPDNGGKLLVSNNGQGSEVNWTFDKVEVGKSDPAFSHDYYLIEKSAPDGYKLNRIKHIFQKGSITGSEGNTSVCYNVGDSESSEAIIENDSNFCNQSNYTYKCQSSADNGEIRDMTEGGNCNFEVTPPTDTETDTTPDDSENPDGSGDTSGGTPGGELTVTWNKVCWNISANGLASKEAYCENQDNYIKVVSSNGNIVVTHVNEKNKVIISKRAVTGDEEVEGAVLKICSKESYDAKKNDCDVAKNIDDVELTWTSSNQPQEWQGLKKGEYYIVEITPPSGYILATTATKFSINELGEVQTEGKVLKDGDPIVIKNTLTTISISKQDIATSKELPGATISICSTYKDENGEYQMYMESDPAAEKSSDDCIPAVLSDKSSATWVSTDKPHQLVGLPAGTYYLVERIAPNNYSTAEAILFTLKEDGTLVDKDGNLLKDKKLVMYDKKIEEVKTGQLSLYLVIGITILVIGAGLGSYYYLAKRNKNESVLKKIRRRKVHKSNF